MLQVCSVCATFRERASVSWQLFATLPNKDVLLASLAPTPTLPRSGHLTVEYSGERYCLLDSVQAAVGRPEICLRGRNVESSVDTELTDDALRTIERDVDGTIAAVKVCGECLQALACARVPPWSLVRCDAGLRPLGLPVLTWIEEIIVSPYRPLRHVVVCRPRKGAEWRPADTFHQTLRGHVIAIPNPSSEALAAVLPLRPETLPEYVSVVLIVPAATLDDVRAAAEQAPVLHVRGAVIALWAQHFCAVHRLSCDETALAFWLQHGTGVPEALVETAIHAQTPEEATTMFGAWRERRGRYDQQDTHGDELPNEEASSTSELSTIIRNFELIDHRY